ncbi:hypothetical protein [Pseudomonas sp. NPDC089401]|uniref:hypothetical protein n=1 Tax=Pseudomonas sp. NPDC089401 TaxID=3364462 RepID=UPI00382FF8F4
MADWLIEPFDLSQWCERMLACRDFASEHDCDVFLAGLAEAERNMNGEIATTLLDMFSDTDDFGVLERARNVLEAADRHVFYPALVAGLAGLLERSPDKQWAMTLLGIEVEHGDLPLLLDYIRRAPSPQRCVAMAFIRSDGFLSEYPQALAFSKGVGAY